MPTSAMMCTAATTGTGRSATELIVAWSRSRSRRNSMSHWWSSEFGTTHHDQRVREEEEIGSRPFQESSDTMTIGKSPTV